MMAHALFAIVHGNLCVCSCGLFNDSHCLHIQSNLSIANPLGTTEKVHYIRVFTISGFIYME